MSSEIDSNEQQEISSEAADALEASFGDASLAVQSFMAPIDANKLDLREEMVTLNRVAKVVKGGRRFSFAALIVVGDAAGHVGVGFGKAKEVPDAIQKAVEAAKKTLIRVPLVGRTIPFTIIGEYGAGRVLLKPASEGTGIIAGPAARSVLELAGVRDILTKALGSQNSLNVVQATYMGLKNLELGESVALRRGKTLEDMMGRKAADRYRKGREEAMNATPVARVAEQDRRDKSRMGTYSAGGRDDAKKNNDKA